MSDDGGEKVGELLDEQQVMRHLDMLLSSSEPGAEMHHLHVLAVPAGGGEPGVSVYAIQPPPTPAGVNEYVKQAVVFAGHQAREAGDRVLWAGLAIEVFGVPRELWDARATRLQHEFRLFEHPAASEATTAYAAAFDGRRWTGHRWLTGPRAGTSEGVQMLVGAPARDEGHGFGRVVRWLVGVK